MATARTPWRIVPGGVSVRLRLTPKSSTDRVEGLIETAEGPAIKARVRAVPEDGKANEALLGLIAGWLGVARTSIKLTAGATARVKSLTITGDGLRIADGIARRLGRAGAT